MLESISHKQWLEWSAYLGFNGLPDRNADGRALDALIVQANMNRKKGKRPNDLVYFESEKFVGEEQTPAQRLAHAKNQMMSLAKAKK